MVLNFFENLFFCSLAQDNFFFEFMQLKLGLINIIKSNYKIISFIGFEILINLLSHN